MRTIVMLIGAACAAATIPVEASAHPHVFIEARMEILGTPNAELEAIRHVWRFDELFSSSVLFDFDINPDGHLDNDELDAVAETIRQSISEWNFFTHIKAGPREVEMAAPAKIRAIFESGQLILFFEMKAAERLNLRDERVSFSTFDTS